MISADPDDLPLAPPPSITADDIAGHHIRVITSGSERLKTLLSLIEAARHHIDLIMYIFADDGSGRQIGSALVAAANRGVRVRTMIDSFGSSALTDSFYDPLRRAGGEICFFSRRLRSSYLIRNHQKLILIDQRIAITGGFNIADSYLQDAAPDADGKPTGPPVWLDLGLVIEGPSISRLRKWCDRLFAYTEKDDGKILKLRRIIRRWPVGKNKIAWLIGGPTERLSPWARTLKRDMTRAQQIHMAMAYFSPGQGMLRRLGRIARYGSASFIMAGKSDNPATIGASRLLYGYLLKRGALISEYDRAMFHMKLIIIDDVVYLGTANFDVRSLFLNVELMLRIADSGFAAQMRSLFHQVATQSQIITPDIHQNRASFFTRLRWLMSFLIVGVVDYTVSRRLNFGLGQNPYRDRR